MGGLARGRPLLLVVFNSQERRVVGVTAGVYMLMCPFACVRVRVCVCA